MRCIDPDLIWAPLCFRIVALKSFLSCVRIRMLPNLPPEFHCKGQDLTVNRLLWTLAANEMICALFLYLERLTTTLVIDGITKLEQRVSVATVRAVHREHISPIFFSLAVLVTLL